MKKTLVALTALTAFALAVDAASPRGGSRPAARPSMGSSATARPAMRPTTPSIVQRPNTVAKPAVMQKPITKPIGSSMKTAPVLTKPGNATHQKPTVTTKPAQGGITKPTVTPKLGSQLGSKAGIGGIPRPGFSHKPNFQYAHKHGVKFGKGYFYRGGHHRHWTKSFFWGQQRAWCYWCPSTCGWYYWQAQHQCFYPVHQIHMLPANGGAAPIGGLPIDPPTNGDPIQESFQPEE